MVMQSISVLNRANLKKNSIMGVLRWISSKIEGKRPTVEQMDENTLSWNVRDGVLCGLKKSESGVEEIVEISSTDPGTGESHLRAHQINSSSDHPPVPEADRDKLVATNPITGAIELVSKDVAFTDLIDVIPEDYAGRAKQVPMVVDAEDKLDLVETVLLETVLAKFTLLADCPNSLAGQAGKGIRVNATEDGLEFYTI